MEKSILTKSQKKTMSKTTDDGGKIVVKLRYDDECGNGHNTFSITGDIYIKRGGWEMGGCIHEEIEKYFPELAHLIPYHNCTSEGPLHYIANTVYHASEIPEKQDKWYFYLENHLIKIVDLPERNEMIKKYGDNCQFKDFPNYIAKKPNIEYARSSAIWPDATLEQLRDENALMARLPALLEDFREKMISIGFVW